MRTLSSLLLSLLVFSPAAFAADQPAKPPTLKTESRLPAAEIKGYYDADTWKLISNLPISAFVVMRGTANRENGAVMITKHTASYPNDAKDAFAEELAKMIKLPYDSVASRMPATAEVYVVFYEPSPTDRQALVYAKAAGDVRFCDIIQYRAKTP